MEGTVKPGDDILMMATGCTVPHRRSRLYGRDQSGSNQRGLSAGEVGYITASIKSVRDNVVGDTVTHVDAPAEKPLAGYRQVNPMVFCGNLSFGWCKISGSARCSGKIAAQ